MASFCGTNKRISDKNLGFVISDNHLPELDPLFLSFDIPPICHREHPQRILHGMRELLNAYRPHANLLRRLFVQKQSGGLQPELLTQIQTISSFFMLYSLLDCFGKSCLRWHKQDFES